MIRSLFLCARLQRCILPSTNLTINSNNQTLRAPVHQYKINVRLKQHTAGDAVKDLNRIEPIQPNVANERTFNALLQRLNCSVEWVKEFNAAYPFSLSESSDVLKNLEFLLSNGVRTDIILDNSTMLTLSHNQLTSNLKIVESMKPIDINDFVALVQVPPKKLMGLKKIAQIEEETVPNKHRIYYMSEMMKVSPSTITKFMSARPKVLTKSFKTFDENLKLLLKYVAPIDILHDLWAFSYSPAIIEERLKQARQGHKKKIMPWMIRCTEKRFTKSIKISSDTKKIAGDKTLVKYLSERLKYDVRTTEAIMQKHPSCFKCRVPRVKETLDYLFDVGLAPVDIAQTPRVFCHSLKTIRKRIEELKSIGCHPHLFIICRSANNYNKFVANWIRVRSLGDKLKEKNVIKE